MLALGHARAHLGPERAEARAELAQAVGEVGADAGGGEALRGGLRPAGDVGARGEADAEPEQPLHAARFRRRAAVACPRP